MQKPKLIVLLTRNQVIAVFEQAKVNGAEYRGDELPESRWQWPSETWMRRRLAELQKENER